jgi:hypothetical protein
VDGSGSGVCQVILVVLNLLVLCCWRVSKMDLEVDGL